MLSRILRRANKVQNISRPFGLKFTQRTIIAPDQDPFIPYTRDQIKQMRENPNFERELREAQELKKKQEHKKLHFDYFSNDSNPENYVSLNLQIDENYDPIEDEIKSLRQKQPFTIFHTRKKELPNITGTYGSIKGSVKKLKPTVRQFIGLHLYDAMAEMQDSRKKASLPLFRALNMVRNHALNVGMEQDHLWVKLASLEKQKRRKGIYYHAMGKGGMMKKDWSRVKITLEEKPVSEIYKMMISGDAPKGLAKLWREKIYEANENLDVVRKFQFLLTAKGRQQRREMIRRKAHILQDQFLVGNQFFFLNFFFF